MDWDRFYWVGLLAGLLLSAGAVSVSAPSVFHAPDSAYKRSAK